MGSWRMVVLAIGASARKHSTYLSAGCSARSRIRHHGESLHRIDRSDEEVRATKSVNQATNYVNQQVPAIIWKQ